jgi:serine protease Do
MILPIGGEIVENNKDNKNVKKSKLKTVMGILLCTLFALAYAFGTLALLQVYTESDDNVVVITENDEESIADTSIAEQFNDNKGTAGEGENTDVEADDSNKTDVIINKVQTVDEAAQGTLTVVTDVTEVVKVAMPSVVAITNEYTAYDSWYGETVDEEASGSGIIIEQKESELLIVTNYHVVEDNNSLIIKFYDDSEAEGYVKGFSEDDDLAIVSVSINDLGDETIDSIAIATLGDSDTLQVGEPAIAIGNSLGYGQSVTTGVISAINRNINDTYLIQTDAAINPGNSGGALLNIRGEVIGINSSKIADYVIEGMGYAIPITTAKPIIDQLMLNETKKKAASDNRGFMGISGTDVTEDAANRYGMPQGAYVADVIEGSGAQNAGIRKGDIITGVDGEKITSMTALQEKLEYYEAGTTIDVEISRQNDGEYIEQTVKVTLGKRED